jgi:hypothetical protein
MNLGIEKEEEMSAEQSHTRWFIDLDWYHRNNRSFHMLAQRHLCPECTKKLGAKGADISEDELFKAIKDCCSHSSDFITEQLPILESIFCVLLANDNQPLNLEEMGKQLSERRGGDAYRTSPEIMSRLLQRDQYYGFCEVGEQKG